MISLDQARTLQGKTMKGQGGEKLGTIDTLYADRENGEPTFAAVHTGLFGGKTSFVPLDQATMTGDDVTVPYDKALVGDAPKIEKDAELSPEEEQRLYAHYGVGGDTNQGRASDDDESGRATATPAGTDRADRADETGIVGRDTSGPTTDDAMTRSEERLSVGTEQRETGRARLRKYIVTEEQTVTVPVSREEIQLTREPITDGNAGAAMGGRDLSEEEHEVVLHEEVPTVSKTTVPVERVRLGTETVTEHKEVSEQVRKEQIDTDGAYPQGTADRTGSDAPQDARDR